MSVNGALRPLLRLAVFMAVVGTAGWGSVQIINAPPRSVGRHIGHWTSGLPRWFADTGSDIGAALTRLDRGLDSYLLPSNLRAGARQDASTTYPVSSRQIRVASLDAAKNAINEARPGDVITFAPGRYRLTSGSLDGAAAGTATERITVRATQPNTVFLQVDAVEGFRISAPYWTFENLNMEGICEDHSRCEHALHIVGNGKHFIARNNVFTNFNAHLKINAEDGSFPDDGLVEQNTLSNTSIRRTANPVTPVDLVAASRWTIRGNLISDFAKAGGDQISYGAFVKGGGADNRIEQNIVLCGVGIKHLTGQQVGLSLGGGGTGSTFCRDRRCAVEQEHSSIAGNFIGYCADDGIYVNKAAHSKILYNTLLDTGGIAVRFRESNADVVGNVVDGSIRVRDDAHVRAVDNVDTPLLALYLGRHPVRDWLTRQSSGLVTVAPADHTAHASR